MMTLASLALGWVGEPAFTQLIEPLVLRVAPGSEAAQALAHTLGVVLAFAIITFGGPIDVDDGTVSLNGGHHELLRRA